MRIGLQVAARLEGFVEASTCSVLELTVAVGGQDLWRNELVTIDMQVAARLEEFAEEGKELCWMVLPPPSPANLPTRKLPGKIPEFSALKLPGFSEYL